MTNADQKAAIRERMAATGENYTTAKRAIEQARSIPDPGEPAPAEDTPSRGGTTRTGTRPPPGSRRQH